MTSDKHKQRNARYQAKHRAKTSIKLKSFAELLAALKAQTEFSQALIDNLENYKD